MTAGTQLKLARCLLSRVFSLARFRVCLADLRSKSKQAIPIDKLAVENAPAKIPLPILKAFLVPSQETVAIGLLVDISISKDGAVSVLPTPEKVRTVGIIRLSTPGIVGTCVQAVFIASIIRA